MFLMKFSSNKQILASEPMFSSYVDLVGFHAHETPEIELKDSAAIPILDQSVSIYDEKELPEWYSPSIGPLDRVKTKPHSYSFFDEQHLFKGASTNRVITIAKKILEDRIKSEHARIAQHLTELEAEFLISMQNLSSGMNEAIDVKKQAISAGLNIYFYKAYTSLQYAKSNMQELILKTHTDILGNTPLTKFEYSILCCLSKLDFVFDKEITNLSSKQNAYVQALAKDDVSGEDNDLFHEIPNYIEQYTEIFQTIEEQIIELIAIYDANNYNELPLAAKLRESIQQFKAFNVQEKINKPIYTVAEIAMQAYCASLVKNAKIRAYFISDVCFNLNCDQSMNLLNNWICSSEFLDPQSKLRHEIWVILFKELIDDLDIVSYVKQSLLKAAKNLLLQNNLSCVIQTNTELQSQQQNFETSISDEKSILLLKANAYQPLKTKKSSNMIFTCRARTNPTETTTAAYCGFKQGFLL